ncbi:MAG: hypothetical protein ACRC0V_09435 [Fusobacteriaceae bacterium]
MQLNILKYDKINIIAKCNLEQRFEFDMLYNAITTDRVIGSKMIRFVNFYFNPKPLNDETSYINILERIVQKNYYMKEFRAKSIEINFDYTTDLHFSQMYLLAKVLTDILDKKKFKKININADIQSFDYQKDELTERIEGYKWFKKKGKNKLLEVKLYKKDDNINRFEIIFYNVNSRFFKSLDETKLSTSKRINKTFLDIYKSLYKTLEADLSLFNDEGISEFINSFAITLNLS